MTEPRVTPQTARVLSALSEAGSRALSGVEIAAVTGLASGSLYPILIRLEEAGWLESAWEAGEPARLGRPRRRFYNITRLGAERARDAAQSLAPLFGRLARI